MIKKILALIVLIFAFVLIILIFSERTVDFYLLQNKGGLIYFQNNSEPFTGKATTKYRNSRQNEHEYYIQNGIVDSYIHYEIDGEILASGKREDGKLNEIIKDYYPDGKLRRELNYTDLKLISAKFYDENGKLEREVNNKDRDRDGLEIIE